MGLNLLTKFHSALSKRLDFPRVGARPQSRGFAKAKKKKPEGKRCPNRTCGDEPKPKKSIWSLFSGKTGDKREEPDKEDCQRPVANADCEPDPDLSHIGGMAYRTAGSAFIVQRDPVKNPPGAGEPEDVLLDRLERHPALKDVEDPMPPFVSVEQRMLKLCELGLHPAYKRYMSIPRPMDLSLPKHVYKSRSGPIADDEYPEHLKVSKECLDRKNIYAEFKRAEPPRQLLAKMLEMKQNERPTLERKGPPDQKEQEQRKHKKC